MSKRMISFRVSDDVAAWLERSAAARGVRKSDVIRMAVERYLDRIEAGEILLLPGEEPIPEPSDWTCDPVTGASNSSPAFDVAVKAVARLIREDAHHLLAGRTEMTAQLIMAQLAHVHGFAPVDELVTAP